MKIGVQLNPQVSIDKPAASLMPTLIEQVRVADQSGFYAFSMGEHYNIPGLQRVHQVPALARLCAEVKHCEVGTSPARSAVEYRPFSPPGIQSPQLRSRQHRFA